MKSGLSVAAAIVVAGLVLLAGSAGAGEASVRLAANLSGGDQAVAGACLAKFNAEGTEGTRRLLQKLATEDFVLRDVRLRERRPAKQGVRLGFDFHNKLEVVTVYMEADCPADLVDPHLPARSAQAVK